MDIRKFLDELYDIVIELDARECSFNCVTERFLSKSWTELCEEAIKLLEIIK